MAQFDVFANEDTESKGVIPFLLDVQHNLHDGLSTRLVVPLVLISSAQETWKAEARKLFPRFRVLGNDVLMSTPEMAGYPVRELRHRVSSLSDCRDEILGAIDFALNGF
jgi:toxin CcdB